MKFFKYFMVTLLLTVITVCIGTAVQAADIVASGKFGNDGDNITWTLTNDNVLTLTGSGEMGSLYYNETPWYSYYSDITEVIIGDNITDIGDCIFMESNIRKVTIGNGVKTIGRSAFSWSSNLEEVIFGESVEVVGGYAFESCSNLKEIIIPDSVESIGDWAFYDCNGIENLTIGKSVKNIGYDAFYHCSKLTSVVIPDSVEYMSTSVFKECRGLTSVTIGKCVVSIERDAFYGCSNIVDLTIGESVRYIGETAFGDCFSLTNVDIPDGVVDIDMAFIGCVNLKTVNIGKNVSSLSTDAFNYCLNLTSINVSEENETYRSIDGVLFKNNTVYEDFESDIGKTDVYQANAELVKYPMGITAETYIIPDGVISISESAFEIYDYYYASGEGVEGKFEEYIGHSYLKNVTIPDSVKRIDSFAFFGCNNLENVTMGNSITVIGYKAFSDCSKLKNIILPDTVSNISEGAFSSCKSLTSIIIPDGVVYIDEGTFIQCTNLVSVTIPASVRYIDYQAFRACDSLRVVNYCSDKAAWDAIEIEEYNGDLTEAYFNWNFAEITGTNAKKCNTSVNGQATSALTGIDIGTDFEQLKEELTFTDNATVELYDANGNALSDSSKLATGCTLKQIDDNRNIIEEVFISVDGDVTGDGNSDILDIQNVISHIAGTGNTLYIIAVDEDLDMKLSMAELNMLISNFR